MLLVKDIKQKYNEFDILFEKIGDGLILISVINSSHECKIPCYWRLTKVCDIPPLEVGIDSQNGLLVSITAFITEIIEPKLCVPLDISQNRDVIVDKSVFTKVYDFIDVQQGYSITKHGGNLVCLFEDEQEPTKAYRNGRFELLIDNCNQIVGFSICDLTEDEIMMIDSLEEGQ